MCSTFTWFVLNNGKKFLIYKKFSSLLAEVASSWETSASREEILSHLDKNFAINFTLYYTLFIIINNLHLHTVHFCPQIARASCEAGGDNEYSSQLSNNLQINRWINK